MSKVNIKKYYSTKRKRDLVTGAAICLFGILIVFQLYITIVFPLQLRHRQLLLAEIEKDEMYEQIDLIRKIVRSTRGANFAQNGEIRLVEGIMDQFALHVREHGKEMTPEQVAELRKVLFRYEQIACAWDSARSKKILEEETGVVKDPAAEQDKNEKPTKKYRIHQDALDTTPYARTIETSILNSR